ncbi:Uma2 family endonuclease [Nocardia caishijiensis]|uniref:Uma2 family endonuclease n=1 Tax=Nocardia caishijiensis TaxID=184756 RepID=A0ABQ6YET3_9NOCA|nr:Uma2 family endonuclease [Nocardia caishijiensis]KAF0835926.1 Uma2 family endonuclease [Nocardia caishijiensis]
MTVDRAADDSGYGPYTVLDLHDLPEDGKGFELEDGWLVEVAAGARHNWIAHRLARILRDALPDDSHMVFDGGEWEISTPSGVRKPDVLVVPRDVARAVIVDEIPKVLPGLDVLLAVEVVSPGSSSERTDRVRKVREYAALGIPEYWIVEHRPSIRILRLRFDPDAGTYFSEPPVASGTVFEAELLRDGGVRIMFDPERLIEF